MRFETIAALLFSALTVSAQTAGTDTPDTNELLEEFTKLPTCVTACIAKALPHSTCADPTDLVCLCADEAYMSYSETCILSSCSVKQALTSQAWQKKACLAPVRDTGPRTRRIGLALSIIALFLVVVRFFARWRIPDSSIGWDDWTILVAFIGLIPSNVIAQIMTYKGMGRDIWTVPFDNITTILIYFYIEQWFYQVVIVATKISIVLLYLRIFPKEVSTRFHYICYAVIAGLLAYGIGFLISFIFQCKPLSYIWNQWDGTHEGVCLHIEVATYVNSAINIFFDLVVFFLPIPKLIMLQSRSVRSKIGVCLIFLVGLFVTVCSAVRLKYVPHIRTTKNPTFYYNNIALWSGLEGDVGVCCACMPMIAGPVLYFFRETIGSRLSSFAKSSRSNSKSTVSTSKPPKVYRISRGDKSITRLPSNASEIDVEMIDRVERHGRIEKTPVTSEYKLPHIYHSDDDERLIDQRRGRAGQSEWDV